MEVRSYSGIATPKTNGRQISGYAVVFNQQSEILYDAVNNRMFKEIIDGKAITPELLKRSDVKAVLMEQPNAGWAYLAFRING